MNIPDSRSFYLNITKIKVSITLIIQLQYPCTHHMHFLHSNTPLPTQLNLKMSIAIEKKKENKRKKTHSHTQNYFTQAPCILAFPRLCGQPPEQPLKSSGETRIAHLTTEKSPYLYPTAQQLVGKDMRMVTDKIEQNNTKAQWSTCAQIILITMTSQPQNFSSTNPAKLCENTQNKMNQDIINKCPFHKF